MGELLSAEPLDGVRLLAPDDPALYLDAELVMGDRSSPGDLDPDVVGRRLLNSLTGRILVDGELVGAWAGLRTG